MSHPADTRSRRAQRQAPDRSVGQTAEIQRVAMLLGAALLLLVLSAVLASHAEPAPSTPSRWTLPAAAWLAPIFAIRFFRDSDKAGRSFLLPVDFTMTSFDRIDTARP